jgi:hypothetical protein
MSGRIATINPEAPFSVYDTHGATHEERLQLIEYTENGAPDGCSLAQPDDLDEWKTDLTGRGWTIVDATEN